MTKGDELRKEILKIFESLRYKRDLWGVYSDFLEMAANRSTAQEILDKLED